MFSRNRRILVRWLKTSIWAFPVILLVLMSLFVTFRITGSSVGAYYSLLFGTEQRDPNLLYGKPRAIRSDEWLVGTQRIISQSRNNFSRTNPDMISGQQVSFKEDLPVKYWTTVFRPQNWGYLVMPLQNAFAFKWWLPMFVLMTGCYFFTLRLFPDKKLFAALISLAVGLSPFELWWYQTGAFMTIGMGFFVALLVMRLLDGDPLLFKNRRRGTALQVWLLAFCLSCFGLIFYPPFQIPIAFVLLFFSAGYFLQKKFTDRIGWRLLAKRLGLVIVGVVLAAVIGILFITTHHKVLSIVNQSAYPGHRIVHGGTTKPISFFNSFVMPLEQSDKRAAHFVGNQSEASNFILLLPFLVVPVLALMVQQWRLKKPFDWLFAAMQVCTILLYVRVFTTFGQGFFKLFFLQRVPDKRLIIGLGFLSIIMMLYLLKRIREAKIPAATLKWWALGYGLACFLVLMAIGHNITQNYPMFVHNLFIVTTLSAAFAAIISALVAGRMLIFTSLFLLFTFASGFRIMPLYRGLDILTNNKVIQKMEAVSKPGDGWATVGDDAGVFENFPLLAHRRAISGVQMYPNKAFWSQIGGDQYEEIYNRQAHAFVTDNPNMKAPIVIASTDSFLVKFECSPFIEKNVDFALSVHPLAQDCASLIDTVNYPATIFYLYRIH